MIFIHKNTKIFVVAPASVATGGPELLHQLVFHLRNDLNIDAYIYYSPSNYLNPLPEAYKKYNDPFVREIEDKKKNILIVPEGYAALVLLKKFKQVRKIIWWLSVDNFYISKNFDTIIFRIINKFWNIIGFGEPFNISANALNKYRNINLLNFPLLEDINLHIVQSRYAMEHLKTKGIKDVAYLSDYLNKEFLEIETDENKKENIVAYNPTKGFKFTRRLIKIAPDFRFIPIQNMTREEVIGLLKRAKVYIDFGNHPGKDRIPREAAMLNCCIITNRRGSANFFEDVSILDDYKFDEADPEIVINKIKDCFENFKERTKDFADYRKIINTEPSRFISDIKKIFIKI